MSKAKDSPLIERMAEKFKWQIVQDIDFRKQLGAAITEANMAERCYLAGAKAMLELVRETILKVERDHVNDGDVAVDWVTQKILEDLSKLDSKE